MQDVADSTIYEFDDFRFVAKTRRLNRKSSGEYVPLQPKAAALLLFFIANDGRLLSKDEILETIWGENFVEESNLSQTVFVLRKALGEPRKTPRFILTVPNRGYQFIAPVNRILPEDNILDVDILTEKETFQIRDPEPEASDPRSAIRDPRVKWLFLPIVLLISLGAYWLYPSPKEVALNELRSIAVLPFEDLSEGPAEKYLGTSLADALVNKFSKIKQITVRPTRSVLKYSDSREDAEKIGRELQVDAVLDGRIQRVGERVQVHVQLIRVSDGSVIWTERFDDSFTNLFSVQDSISGKVARSLALRMDNKERQRFSRRGTENGEAYQDYLRGVYFMNKRINDHLPKAVAYFEQAIQKDPEFALAYAGLAYCHLIMPEYVATSTQESYPLAKKFALKALELDEELGEAHLILGGIIANQSGFGPESEKEFKRAIELSPNSADAHRWFAHNLRAEKVFDKALVEYRRASELDPTSVIILINVAQTLKEQGNYDAAIEELNKAIAFDPNHAIVWDELARVLYKKGLYSEALPHSEKAVGLSNRLHTLLVTLGELHIKLGQREKALEVIRELEEKQPGPASYYIAMLYAEIGDREKMYDWLEKAIEEKPRDLHELTFEPNFEFYRSEPRFQEFVRKVR